LSMLMEDFRGNILELSVHPFGCRIVQRLLENCSNEQVEVIVNEVFAEAPRMCLNEYGNYIIQHILGNGLRVHKIQLYKHVHDTIAIMCTNKFASNVVEAFWNTGIKSVQESILDQLMETDSLDILVRDKFGNFVIQKMMTVGSFEQRKRMFARLDELFPHLMDLPYGRFIAMKMESLREETDKRLRKGQFVPGAVAVCR